MTLLLIRHGETALNAARVLQPADTPLSARGAAQAEALAGRLAAWADQPGPAGEAGGARLAGILSSDLPRALATAEAVGRACGLPVATTPLLHERNFGDLRGRRYDDLGFDPLTQSEAPPGGESQAAFARRCVAAWGELRVWQARLGGPLAVVTHGMVIRCWLTLGPLTLAPGVSAPERLGNTGLTVAPAAPPHAVVTLNCTAHLRGELAEGERSLSGG